MRVHHSFRVARRVEHVFDFLADPRRLVAAHLGTQVEVTHQGRPHVGQRARYRLVGPKIGRS